MSNQKFCKQCGRPLDPDMRHCPDCGTPQSDNYNMGNLPPQPQQQKQRSNTMMVAVIALLSAIVIGVIVCIVLLSNDDKEEQTPTPVATTDVAVTTQPAAAPAPAPAPATQVEPAQPVPTETAKPKRPKSDYMYVAEGGIGPYKIIMEITVGNGIYGRYRYRRKNGLGGWLYLNGSTSGSSFTMNETTEGGKETGYFEGTFTENGERLKMNGTMWNAKGEAFNFHVSGLRAD